MSKRAKKFQDLLTESQDKPGRPLHLARLISRRRLGEDLNSTSPFIRNSNFGCCGNDCNFLCICEVASLLVYQMQIYRHVKMMHFHCTVLNIHCCYYPGDTHITVSF